MAKHYELSWDNIRHYMAISAAQETVSHEFTRFVHDTKLERQELFDAFNAAYTKAMNALGPSK